MRRDDDTAPYFTPLQVGAATGVIRSTWESTLTEGQVQESEHQRRHVGERHEARAAGSARKTVFG
jgi:hypothetical protein